MRKFKLISFLLFVLVGLIAIFNIYSITPPLPVKFTEVIANDAIRSQLNFSFYQRSVNERKSVWQFQQGVLKQVEEEESDEANRFGTYYPYSNLAYPFNFKVGTVYEVSEQLKVAFPLKREDMEKAVAYIYPKTIVGHLFDSIELDLTYPMDEYEAVCVALNHQAELNSFNSCYFSPELEPTILAYQNNVNIQMTVLNGYIYWSISGSKGLLGDNHLYRSIEGRFDQIEILDTWDNQTREVLALITKENHLLMLCEDGIYEYDEQGKLLERYEFKTVSQRLVPKWINDQLVIYYYDEQLPSYQSSFHYEELIAVNSMDLKTQTVYDYDIHAFKSNQSEMDIMVKDGYIYTLTMEKGRLHIEVSDGRLTVYEAFVEQNPNYKGIEISKAKWR